MLILPIKKKWFDMIRTGEKTEEYRDLSPYWEKRLRTVFGNNLGAAALGRRQSFVALRNGYGQHRPTIVARVSLRVGTGRPEWGAEPGTTYFVLCIHDFFVEETSK